MEEARQTLIISALSLFMLLVHTQPLAAAPDPQQAQQRNIQFSNLTTEDGLSSEFIHDVLQDSAGYLWFATQSGLNRFDGHTITAFENAANEPGSLSNSFAWSLLVDEDGNLLVGTERGVNRYDPASDTFDRSPWPTDVTQNLRARRLAQDGQGRIWIGTVDDGLVRIDPASGASRHFRAAADAGALPDDHITALLVDSYGRLWVGTDGGGLARFDNPTETFITYSASSNLASDQVRSIFEDSRGDLWVGTAPGGLHRLTADAGRFSRYQHDPDQPRSLPAGQVTAIFEDRNGSLWVGTESGLAEWRQDLKGFITYHNQAEDPDSLVNDRVNAITQDRSGVLWLATHGGISAWNYFSDTFQYYSTREGFLQSDLVTSLAEQRDGTLWVGTYGGGLSRIDLGARQVRHYRHDPLDAASLPDDRVMAVHVDGDDALWVGTRAGGLARLNGNDFTHYRHDPNRPGSLPGDAITSILSTRDGSLWVGVFDEGASRLPRDGTSFRHYRQDDSDDSLSGDRVLEITEDSTGQVWLGTEGAGLNRFNGPDAGFTHFSLEERDDGQPAGTPWNLHFAANGTVWLGTLGQGLLRWRAPDREQGRADFDQYATSRGVASSVFGVVEGDTGELWLSSNRGLIRFEPDTRRTRVFDNQTGLRTNEFNQGASLRSRSGRLFFGSQAGLVGFFPGEIPNNPRPPEIAVTARSRTDTLARTHSNQDTPLLTLDYFDAFVAFDFVALDFVSPDKNRYRYRLVGLDPNWTFVDQYPQAIFSGLSPGNYRFEVQASNNDGVWNESGAAVAVYVVPPPWRSNLAYTLYGILALILGLWIAAAIRARRLAAARDRERLEHLVSERTHELAERNRELTELNNRLEETSITDALTGLRNRRFVDQHIAAELSMLRRLIYEEDPAHENPDSPRLLFLMMIDLDGFKAINDTFGHQAGDLALLEVKDRLLATCRKSDAVVRWGGDEFLIIGHARSMAGAESFAEKVRQSIDSEHYDVGEGNLGKLSSSIGLSTIPFVERRMDFATWEQVCAIADIAAYVVKKSTKNNWLSLTGTDLLAKQEVLTLKDQLPQLIAAGKVRAKSPTMSRAELIKTVANQLAQEQALTQ